MPINARAKAEVEKKKKQQGTGNVATPVRATPKRKLSGLRSAFDTPLWRKSGVLKDANYATPRSNETLRYSTVPMSQWTSPQRAAYANTIGDDQMLDQLALATDDEGSIYRNPYRFGRNTMGQEYADFFKTNYGYDGPFDQSFLDNFRFLRSDNINYTDTYSTSKPGKKSSMEDWAAWRYTQIAMNVAENEQVNSQWDEARKLLSDNASQRERLLGRKLTREEFLEPFDISKYSKLQDIDKSLAPDNYDHKIVQLPTGTFYSPDILDGVYNAYLNDDDITVDRDYYSDAVQYWMAPAQKAPSTQKYTWSGYDLNSMAPEEHASYVKQLRAQGKWEEAAAYNHAVLASDRLTRGLETPPTVGEEAIGYYKDDAWFEKAYEILGTDYDDYKYNFDNGETPKKTALPMEKFAYEVYKAEKTRADTDAVQAEYDNIKGQIADIAKESRFEYGEDEFGEFEQDILNAIDLEHNTILKNYFNNHENTNKYCRNDMPISEDSIHTLIKFAFDGKDITKDYDYTAIDEDDFEAPFYHVKSEPRPLFYEEDQRMQTQTRIADRNNAEKEITDAMDSLTESGIPASKGELPVISESYGAVETVTPDNNAPDPLAKLEDNINKFNAVGVLGKLWFDSKAEYYKNKLGEEYTPKQAAAVDAVLKQTDIDAMPEEITTSDIEKLVSSNAMAYLNNEDITLATGIIAKTLPGAKHLLHTVLNPDNINTYLRNTGKKFNAGVYKSVYDDRIDAGLTEEDAADVAYFAATDLNAANESVTTRYNGDRDIVAAADSLMGSIASEDGAKDSYEIIKGINDDVNKVLDEDDTYRDADVDMTELNAAMMVGSSEAADPAFRAQTNAFMLDVANGNITPEDIIEGSGFQSMGFETASNIERKLAGITPEYASRFLSEWKEKQKVRTNAGSLMTREEYDSAIDEARGLIKNADHFIKYGNEYSNLSPNLKRAIGYEDIESLAEQYGWDTFDMTEKALDALVHPDKVYNTQLAMDGWTDIKGQLEELAGNKTPMAIDANRDIAFRDSNQSYIENSFFLSSLIPLTGRYKTPMGQLVDTFRINGKFFSADEVSSILSSFRDGSITLQEANRLIDERISSTSSEYANALNHPEELEETYAGFDAGLERLGSYQQDVPDSIAAMRRLNAGENLYDIAADYPELMANLDLQALRDAYTNPEMEVDYEGLLGAVTEKLGSQNIEQGIYDYSDRQISELAKLTRFMKTLGPSGIYVLGLDNDIIKTLTDGEIDLDGVGLSDSSPAELLSTINPGWLTPYGLNPGTGAGYVVEAGLSNGLQAILSVPAKAIHFTNAVLGTKQDEYGLAYNMYKSFQKSEEFTGQYEGNVATKGERFVRQATSEFVRNLLTSAVGAGISDLYFNAAMESMAGMPVAEMAIREAAIGNGIADLSAKMAGVDAWTKVLRRLPFAGNVFFNKADEELRNGKGAGTAGLLGMVDAGIELFTENLPLEKLMSFKPGAENAIRNIPSLYLSVGANAMKSVVTEIGEEEAGLVLERLVGTAQDVVKGKHVIDAIRENYEGIGQEAVSTALSTAFTTLMFGVMDFGGATMNLVRESFTSNREISAEEFVHAMELDVAINADKLNVSETAENNRDEKATLDDEKKSVRAYDAATQVPSFGSPNITVEENAARQAGSEAASEVGTESMRDEQAAIREKAAESAENVDETQAIETSTPAEAQEAATEEALKNADESGTSSRESDPYDMHSWADSDLAIPEDVYIDQENARVAELERQLQESTDNNQVSSGTIEQAEDVGSRAALDEKKAKRQKQTPSDPVQATEEEMREAAYDVA